MRNCKHNNLAPLNRIFLRQLPPIWRPRAKLDIKFWLGECTLQRFPDISFSKNSYFTASFLHNLKPLARMITRVVEFVPTL
jgi:hypothetical protein